MGSIRDLVSYICHRVAKCINSVLWPCCLASVWCAWALVFCACSHLLWVINWLQTAVHMLTLIPFIFFRFYLFFLFSFKINFLNYFIYFIKDFSVVIYSSFVLTWEYVLNIIFKLLSANCTYHMICSWFWFFYAFRVFFIFGFFPSGIFNVIFIFLIQKLQILFCKFPFLLKLKYRCSERGWKIECRDIIFSNINPRT